MRCFSWVVLGRLPMAMLVPVSLTAVLMVIAPSLPAADAPVDPKPPVEVPGPGLDPAKDPAKPPTVEDPTLLDPTAMPEIEPVEPPPDELSQRRERHQDLLDAHPSLGMGAADERWQQALAVADEAQKAMRAIEAAQQAVATPEGEMVTDPRTLETQSRLEDKLLALDQLLDRMDIDGELLEVAKKLDGHDELAQRGGKAKQLAGLRERLLGALNATHALQRDALALRHHAAAVQEQADAKELESEKTAESVEEARAALTELGDRIDDALSPVPSQDGSEQAPMPRHF